MLLIGSATMNATQFTVNGFTYEISSGSRVKVILAQYGATTLHLGGTVTYNNKTYTITDVDPIALRNNAYIRTVKVSDNYELRAGAFMGCYNLNTVDMSEVNSEFNYDIADSVFYECYNINTLKLPVACWKIGKDAFHSCASLSELTVNDVYIIEPTAFSGCTGVRTIRYNNTHTLKDPNNLTEYIYKSALGSVAPFYPIRDKITTAYLNTGANAVVFSNMPNLTTVYVGTDVKVFYDKVFMNCTSLTKIYLGTSTSDALGGLKNISNFSDYCLYGCTQLTGKATLNGKDLSIYPYAFSQTAITALDISTPDNWVHINENAFLNCTSLQTIDLNMKVSGENFSKSAFSGCTGVKKVTWTGSDPYYNTTTLSWGNGGPITKLTNLEELVIHRTGRIYSHEFDGLEKLKNLTIESEVTRVEDYAFNNCTNITTVKWNPSGNRDFYSSADVSPFYSSQGKITSITFGSSVNEIPSYLLFGQTALTSVAIHSGITAIDHHAFFNVPLTSISLSRNVKSIGSFAFYGCKVSNVTLPPNLEYIGEQAIVSSKPMTVQWDAQNCKFDYSYKGDGKGVFYDGSGDKSISAINFGSQVQSLPARLCFQAKNLTSIKLPESLKSVGDSAFYGCSNLIYIESKAVTPPALKSEKVFKGCNSSDPKGLKGITLVVPDQSLSLYKKAEYWKDFFESSEGIVDVQSDDAPCTKVLRDGKIYIKHGDRLYDLTGAEVQ